MGRAQFDPSGAYRYSLERCWQSDGEWLVFVMLNPSRADQQTDDPTIRRCSQFAQTWGYGNLEVVNLFAYRTPHPRLLKQAAEPIGSENDQFLLRAARRGSRILLAWGNGGSLLNRDGAVLELLQPYAHKFACLGRNCTGQPRHPLYVRRDAQCLAWSDWGPGADCSENDQPRPEEKPRIGFC